VWCYECDEDIGQLAMVLSEERTKDQHAEFVESIQVSLKAFLSGEKQPPLTEIAEPEHTPTPAETPVKKERIDLKDPKVEEFMVSDRGLRNLGNTCFFNSTMQCLNATTELVVEYITAREFPYPKGSINAQLKDFFYDLRKGQGSYNPSELFSGICRRVSRFRGF